MTFLDDSSADLHSFKVNPFPRADRNPFFMLSLLPPPITLSHQGNTIRIRIAICQFGRKQTLLLMRNSHFAPAHRPPALHRTTSAVLQVPSAPNPGLVARECSSTKIPAPALARPVLGSRLGNLGCKKVWFTSLRPYSLQIKHLLNWIHVLPPWVLY